LQVEREETPLLVLIVDDVEGIEDCLHPGIRTPERHGEADHEAEAERAAALRGDAGDLLTDDVERAAREDAREGVQMLLDRDGIGE
jgi:hypothetical protein